MNDFITIEQLQNELQISRATAYRIAKKVPHVTIGRSIRISRSALLNYARLHDWSISTGDSSSEKNGRL